MSERDELLLALSASCQAHKEQQHSSPELQQDTIPPKCKNDLETLRQLLPRVEDSFNPRENPHPAHAMHLCDFYLSMLSGLFCPHFRGLFRCDKNTNEVLPRVQLLLEYLVSRPLCQAATSSDLFAPCVTKIAITIARLLCLIPTPSSCIVHDLVTLCIDLAAVDESNVVNDKQTVSVSMLPETSKPWGPEKQLKVSNEDALSVLKGALPQILIEFSGRAEETDMNHIEIGVSPQAQPVAHTTCTALSGWCVSVMLGACRQTFQRAGSKSIKSMRIQTEAKISFGSFLSKLRCHWNQTGPPSVSLACHAAIVVVRAVSNHLRMTAVTPRVARLADLSQLLSNLLCGFVLYPPTMHGRSWKGVSSICWSCCMQPLLECLRNAASIHDGGDGAELLHTVLCTIHIMLSFDQSAAGLLQGNRLSTMAYGHCAKNGLFPDLVALLSSKRSSRAAVHIIGIMSGLVGQQKELRRNELHFAIALCVQRYRRENKAEPQEVEASPKGKRRRSQPSPADRTKTPPLDLVLSPKRRKSNSASSTREASSPKVCRRVLFSNGDRYPSPASQSLTDALVSKLSLCCTYLVRNSKSHQLNVSETKELDLCLGVFCLLYLMLSKSTNEEFEPLKRDTDWLFEMGCHMVKREHAKFYEAGSSPLHVPPTWWQGIVDIGLLSRFCLYDADFKAARGAPTSLAKLVATLVWQHVLQLGRQDVVDDRLRTRADFASGAISWMTRDVAKLGKKGDVTGFPSCLYGAGAYMFWDETRTDRPRHCDGIAVERLFNLELDIKVPLLATLLPDFVPTHQIGEESKEGGVVQNGNHALGCLACLLRARETTKSAPPLAIVNLYALAPLMALTAAVPMEERFSQDNALGHGETFRNTISGLLRAFPIEGFIMIAENDADPLAQQAALLACRRLCGFKPIVRSPVDVNADFIYQWITDPMDTIVTAQGESCFRDAQFLQLLSADYSREEETGPGAWSMLASAAMRTRSNDLRRLASGHNIAKNEKNSASFATAVASSRKLGTIQWLLSAPFSDSRYALRLRASKMFGELLLGNHATILFAVFGQDGEFDAFQRNVGEHHRTDFHSDNHNASVVSRIFQEIDTILYRHCFVPQSQLSFTVATTSHCSGESTGGATDSRSHALVRARYHYTAVRSFASLCQECAAVATSSLGKLVFEFALLRLVRFWAMFFRLAGVEDGAEVCISALAYRELRKLSMMGMLEDVVAPCGMETFSPGLFSDMLLPAANFVLSDAAVSSAARAQQFRLFAGFISAFLVKIQSATVVPESKGAARMLHIHLSARSMDLVIDHVDDCIRFVFPVFILEKDYDTLRLTTAFKLFLLGEKRNIEKGRERSYVGSTFNELSRTRTSRKKQPDLDEQTMNLCLSPDKIEHVLPRLLMYHEDRSQLVFFLQTVLRKRISLSQMINKRDELVLKSIVWELGGEDSGARAIQALKTAAIAKHHIGRERPLQEESAEDAATIWVSSHFMYLLVNVVQYRWKQRTTRDKMKALRSLGVMLHFLVPSEAQQFVPQILATVCMAFDVRSNIEDQQTLRLLAVQAMSQYVRLLTEENCDVAGKNLATMVVTLLPVLSAKTSDFPTPKSRQAAKESERVAVELFNVLTSGTLGRQFAPYFKDLPFLPATAGLMKIRENLKGNNVDLDSDFLLVSTQDSQPSASARESIASGSSIEEPSWLGANMERALLKRLSVLCPLLPHESASVRLVAVEKITELVRSNRSLFFRVLKRQEETSQHHFLTVDFKEVDRAGSVVGICDAIESLLRRCVAERDSRCRNALATCVGEIGAVDSNRLATLRIRSAFAKGTKGRSWLLSNPPWQSIAARYELELLTHHLVTSLRAATSSVDQHKIAFTIQQLLVDLDSISRLGGREKRVTSSLQKGGDRDHPRGNMTVWLRDHLHQAGVLETIETYWHSKFSEIEPFSARTPPFFSRSSSYFGWISHWCRYMITRARDGSRSQLHNLFYSCRTAIRSSAGLSVAEFILPLLILDRLCFGDKSDEKMIEEEFCSVLSHPSHGTGQAEGIEQNDVPKAVKTVFMALDTLEWWAEHEVEDQHRRKRSGGSTRPETVQMFGSAAIDSCWPVDRSIDAIGKVLTLVPLSLRARAAMSCDMHARSLRYVELAARNEGVERRFNTASVEPAAKDVCREVVESTHLAGVDTQILKEVLEGLADYETLNGLDVISGTWQGWESITEKEANGDWMGAWNLCERAIQLSRDRGEKTKLETVGLRCLLHLGQFETVLKQANGILERNRVYGQQEGADPSRESEYLVLPFATEAAWQLGQWDDLERMLERDATFKQRADHCEIFRVSVGRAMLGLRDGSENQVRSAIEQGRRALMNGLSQLASESYARAYPALVRLHSLREIEDALHVLSLRDGCNDSRPSISAMTASGGQGSLDWDTRLQMVSPVERSSIVDVRLGLARILKDSALEGSLLYNEGRRLRKEGLHEAAATLFAKAENAFKFVGRDQSPSALAAGKLMGNIQVQVAKIHHQLGRSGNALGILGNSDVRGWSRLEKAEIRAKVREIAATDVSQEEAALEHFTAKLVLSTKWMVESGLQGVSEIMERYRIAVELLPESEKGHFHFAKYVDSVLEARVAGLVQQSMNKVGGKEERNQIVCADYISQDYLVLSLELYLRAMTLNSKHVYQALPRLLSLWFEFNAMAPQPKTATSKRALPHNLAEEMTRRQHQTNHLVSQSVKSISPQAFYTVMPQLISRVTHANKETAMIVETILTRILTKFPSQAMWNLSWLRNSVNSKRSGAGERIFKEAQQYLNHKKEKSSKAVMMLTASKSLVKFLIDLAKFIPKDGSARAISLAPWKGEAPLHHFVPPIQAALSTPQEPGRSTSDHFPRIRTFCAKVGVMSSKARPKKLKSFVVPPGTRVHATENSAKHKQEPDIGELHFLVKNEAKGDLRKDARVQDLNIVINRLMASPGSGVRRGRRLHLRTFAVTCLSEDCGILEWVPHTESFRSLISKTYNPQASPFSTMRRGKRLGNVADPAMRQHYERCQNAFFKGGDLSHAASMFATMCSRTYPPLFYWWFVQNFMDPHAWYEARVIFTASAAVWSAVGHVIGLGDRHSENILIDRSTGSCVHVDFDCIFDKGLALPKPEVIPFRLTPNMLDAFGPIGANGMFSGSLQSAMSTLRNNKDTLLSVLEPFLNDPIIDWKRYRSQQKQNSSRSGTNREANEAKRSINVIDERLRGIYNLRNPNLKKFQRVEGAVADEDEDMARIIPLSVEGQVHKMISEATKHENLVQLYIGWMPWV